MADLGLGWREWYVVLPSLPEVGGCPIHCLMFVFVRTHSVISGRNPVQTSLNKLAGVGKSGLRDSGNEMSRPS